MRDPPLSQLAHDRRFARERNFLGPFAVYTHAISARRKRWINQFEFDLLSRLVIDEGERVMDIRVGHELFRIG